MSAGSLAVSLWELVLPLAVSAVALLLTVFASRLSRLLRLSTEAQVVVSRDLARVVHSQQQQRLRREPILIPDYVDRELLEDIGRQKGLQVDRVQWEVGQSESETIEKSTSLKGALGVPGTSLTAGVGAREARERGHHRARTAERAYNTRSLLNEVIEALDKDGELQRDLADVPEEAEVEAMLMQNLMYVWGEWELDGLADDDPRKEQENGVDALVLEAIERITKAKAKELRDAVPGRNESRFAVIETEWTVSEGSGGATLLLSNEWLVERAADTGRVDSSVLVPDLIVVPLDPTKLVGMGRQRVRPGPARWWKVFGKIEMYEDDALQVLPIVVASP